MINYVRFKTRNPLKDNETYSNIPGYCIIKDPVASFIRTLPCLEAEFKDVYTSFTELGRSLYFDNLKEDFLALITISKEAALAVINQHNHSALEKFSSKVNEAEDAFFNHPDRKYKHLERITRVKPAYFAPWIGVNLPEKKEEILNKNFFEINIESDLLDSRFTDKYLELLEMVRDALISELWSKISIYQRNLETPVKSSEVKGCTDEPKDLDTDSNRIFKQINITTSKEQLDELIKEAQKYFNSDDHYTLRLLLEGKEVEKKVSFTGNGNQWGEVFGRLIYNGFLTGSKTSVEDWICSNFNYINSRNNIARNFKKGTVHDILTKRKGEPPKGKRICNLEWLLYKRPEENKR